MVYALTGQAPLVIQYQRRPKQLLQKESNKGAFVEMAVNNMGPEQQTLLYDLIKQQSIKIKLVPGGTCFKPGIPGDCRDTDDRYAGDVSTKMIGDDADIMACHMEGAGLLVNSDMTAPVSEIRGWRNHQNFQSRCIRQD